jgi:hypothetical protein
VKIETKPTSEVVVSNGIKPKIEASEPKAKEEFDTNVGVAHEVVVSCNNHVSHDVASPQKAVVASPSMPRPPPGLQAPPQSVLTENRKIAIPPGLGLEPACVDSLTPQHHVIPNSSSRKPGPPPGMPPPMRLPMGPTSTPPKHATSSILPARTPPAAASKAADFPLSTASARPLKPRRTQTRCEEQPGRLFANDVPAAAFSNKPDTFITARPRSELTARWILPLKYLRNRALQRFEEQKAMNGAPPQNLTIRDALKNLAVGLFRRGADSGSQSAIVSKEILAPKDGSERQGGRPLEDYFFNVDQQSDSVFGTVPFYAPR